MNTHHVLLLALAMSACGAPGSSVLTNTWFGIDGRSFPGNPHLTGEGDAVTGVLDDLPARLGIVTWPELEPVASEVTVAPDPRGAESHGPAIWVGPRETLQDRWYAVRWSGETHPNTRLIDGVPLVDGSWVWRFHGRYVPELTQLAYEGNTIHLDGFDGFEVVRAVVAVCDSPAPAAIVEQDANSWSVECGLTERPGLALEVPGLDPARPFRVQVFPNAVRTSEGVAFQAIDLTIDGVTSLRVELPPARNPPPVPTPLCAGVSCE